MVLKYDDIAIAGGDDVHHIPCALGSLKVNARKQPDLSPVLDTRMASIGASCFHFPILIEQHIDIIAVTSLA